MLGESHFEDTWLASNSAADYRPHQPLYESRAHSYNGAHLNAHGHAGLAYGNDAAQEYQYSAQHNANDGFLDVMRTPASMPSSRRPSVMTGYEGSFHGYHTVPQSAPLKRKRSEDLSLFDGAPVQKRATSAQLQVHGAAIYDNSGQNSPYSPYAATPVSNSGYQAHGLMPASRMGHQYSTSNASQVSLAAPSPHTPGAIPDFATVNTEPSPQAPMTPPIARPASSSPVKGAHPTLVRTSTIHPSMGSTFHPNYSHSSFNPYSMQSLKATLKLKGDLDSMTKNWTESEASDRRRLVEFTRSQLGNNIHAEFKPVKPEDRAPNSITISCIYWKEKNDHYVTSVDTIYLLEALVGVRFTVEEKNRIRRNLEGYRPATVSKSRLDSEEFFKVIMGFPHPKPRNIEKDVKVFPWKILAEALRKIIGKYSASYSSTAGTISTVPSNYGAEMCEMGYPPSPPEAYIQYAQEQAAYPPGMIPGRMSAPVTTAPSHPIPPQLQVQMVTSGPSYAHNEAYAFNNAMAGMPQASMLMSADPMSAPIHAPSASWEYEQYVNQSPVTAPPHTAPVGAWNRPSFESADFQLPMHYHG